MIAITAAAFDGVFAKINVVLTPFIVPVGTSEYVVFGEVLAKTKAVVANCVVLVPTVAVGAVGVPVSAGEDNGAFALKSLTKVDNCVKSAGFNNPALVPSAKGTVASVPVLLVTVPSVGLAVYPRSVEPALPTTKSPLPKIELPLMVFMFVAETSVACLVAKASNTPLLSTPLVEPSVGTVSNVPPPIPASEVVEPSPNKTSSEVAPDFINEFAVKSPK